MKGTRVRFRWVAPIFLLAMVLAGCAGTTIPSLETDYTALVEEQRRLVESGASATEWIDLGERFLSLAEADPSSREEALFGAAIAFLFADEESGLRRAVRAFETLLSGSLSPGRRAEALYWVAEAYERLGREELARLRYQSLVNDHPDSRYASAAWEKLTGRPSPVLPPIASPGSSVPEDGSDLGRVLGLGVETIVIDPGHGGKDPGAVQDGRPPEKAIALDVGERLAARLCELGYRVFLTRSADVFLPLRERNRLAREWNADLFLSLHVNFAESDTAHGIETWIAAPARDEAAARIAARENRGALSFHDVTESLAALLTDVKIEESRRLADHVGRSIVGSTRAVNRGTKEAPFVVLLGLRVPSVLIELGFLTHREEATRLSDPAYRERLAEGIAEGVRRYVASLAAVP